MRIRSNVPFDALLLLAACALCSPAGAGDSDPDDRWADTRAVLRALSTGTLVERRAAADSAFADFLPLFEHGDDARGDEASRTIAAVRSLMRTETDDFVSYRLLDELAFGDGEAMTPLFLDALKDRSPNLQWSAVRWLAEHVRPEALPDLQYAWRHEERPWVRRDLMIALARHGSHDEAEDFLGLARGKDPALACAAIRALTILGDPAVIPFLAKIARTSRSNAGLLAIDALGRWPDSSDALDAALEASRSPHADVQRHAAAILGRFTDPEGAGRAFELATGRGDANVRAAALEALASARGIEPAVPAAVALDILHEAATSENAPAQSAAIATLRRQDDPMALLGLADIVFDPKDSRFHELAWLKAFLGRPRPRGGGDETATEIKVDTDSEVVLAEDEPAKQVIVPTPTTMTVRCWRFPDTPGDPRELRRLASGTEVRIHDHFEQERESWVQIDKNECWVPLPYVESPAVAGTSNEANEKEATMVIRREFDLPASEVESDVSQGLMDAGILEVIEEGDEVIGVAITIDPTDFDRVLLLARSCGLNETMLDAEIYEIVADLAPLYRGHPVLDRFRRAPQPPKGETDSVIDLDLEELTDK